MNKAFCKEPDDTRPPRCLRCVAGGAPTRVREVVRKAGLPDAACATRSADGRSCVARIQRHYIRRRAELGGG